MEQLHNGKTLVLDGDFAYFGLYPQTHVSDLNLIKSLNAIAEPESNGWYLFDGKYYAKVTAKPHHADYKYRDGSLIKKSAIGPFFHKKTIPADWFLCESIKWRALKKENDVAYLLSDLLLDAHSFDLHSNDFDNTEIKSWLNGAFKKHAFLGYEDSIIGDVLLPSKEDMQNVSFGFDSDESRKAKLTDWALANGASQNNGYGWYYTGTSSSGASDVWCINNVGLLSSCYVCGNSVKYDGGVRPLLRVQLP